MNVYFIERLTVWSWVFSVMPHLIRNRIGQPSHGKRLYVFDGSRSGRWIARASRLLTGVAVEPLRFRLVDVRDEHGLLLRLRIEFRDLAEAQADIMQEPLWQAAIHDGFATPSRLPAYLAKALVTINLSARGTLWRALLVVQICAWALRREPGAGTAPVLFLRRRPWIAAIVRYASRCGVTAVPVWGPPTRRAILVSVLSPSMINRLRSLRALRLRRILSARAPSARPPHEPRIAVEYYGHLNLNDPTCHSDLFFWQQSSIPGRDMLVTFAIPRDPLDEQKWAQLSQRGITAIALHPDATTIPQALVFTPRISRDRRAAKRAVLRGLPPNAEVRWLREQIRDYRTLRAYWTELLESQGIKVYVSWFKYSAAHCVIADAMAGVGGVNVLYQRACDFHPAADTMISTDVVFGFSALFAEIERQTNSRIPYYVITGYLGDYRFKPLREAARQVRTMLHRRGATRILAFFDENSRDDERWHSGHAFMQANYSFLLEKVLMEPWFGLIVKPKVPSTLRRRLGPVAALLTRAEATGRCLVYEGGALHGSQPPVAAALAADVAVHGHLCAATAAIEAALAGVPTLLMDREGWSISPLYRLGVGRVVFSDWPSLWAACVDHWKRPDGIPGFGDWSPMWDELDPFRDGRAAERMGTYLTWLLEGFKAGLKRETVMADAAQRYAELWGADKITHVVGSQREPATPDAKNDVAECLLYTEPARQGVSS